MLYFEPGWLLDAAEGCAGRRIGTGLFDFPQVLQDEPALAPAIFAASRQVAAPDSAMHRDAALDAVVALLVQRYGARPVTGGDHTVDRGIAARAREAIDANRKSTRLNYSH